MNDKLDILLTRMRELEGEIKREIQCKEGEFLYKVRKQKVCFTGEARAQHRKLAKKLHRTVLDSKFLVYWCPIKHALKINSMHSRYGHFFDYGNAEDYHKRIEDVRRSFRDLEPQSDQTPEVR